MDTQRTTRMSSPTAQRRREHKAAVEKTREDRSSKKNARLRAEKAFGAIVGPTWSGAAASFQNGEQTMKLLVQVAKRRPERSGVSFSSPPTT